MTRYVRAGLVGFLAIASAEAVAIDTVKARFVTGYPPPGVSAEGVTLEVTRIAGDGRTQVRPVDTFFDAVRAALKSCGITQNWALVSPDSSFVELEIAMDGARIKLVTDRYGLRPEAQRDLNSPLCDVPRQSENDRNRAALDRILELLIERARSKGGR